MESGRDFGRIFEACLESCPDGPSGHLTIQFLEWIAEAPEPMGR